MCHQARSDRRSMVIVILKGDNIPDVIRWLSMILKVIFITKSTLHSTKTAFFLTPSHHDKYAVDHTQQISFPH